MQPFTRRCVRCRKARDADDLYADEKSTTCLLCVNRNASFAAKAERTAQRIRERQTRATRRREALSPAERYRRELEQSGAGYTDAQTAAYVAARFPNEALS